MQTAPSAQQQKVTYAATTQLQPGIKTQFFTTTTPIAQAPKPAGAQQIQVAHHLFTQSTKSAHLFRVLLLI